MRTAFTQLVLRLKIFCYALFFRINRLLVILARTLPNCWTTLGIPKSERADVETWINETVSKGKTFGSNARAPRYLSFGVPRDVPRRNVPPPGLNGVHPELQKPNLEFRKPFLAALPSARLLGPYGSVITPDGEILTQSTWSSGVFQQDRVFRSLKLPTPTCLSGSYYTIASPYFDNYYHWVIEVLPRLFAYDSVSADKPRLIVNADLRSWQLESLALAGFKKEELVTLKNEYLQLEDLYLPSHIGINPITLEWLRQKFARDTQSESTSTRVYITRRRAARRRLLNESELETILQKHGFIMAAMEDLSFAEQVQLFARAEAIVSIHGAGLTNMVFAPAGCRIMEIVDPMHIGAMYYMLAETLQHKYWSCVGQSAADNSLQHGGAHGHDDVTVSVELFGETLAQMLDARPEV